MDIDTGGVGPETNWSGSVPIDLARADYDADGTLYAITKADQGKKPTWSAVDLERGTVTSVSPLPLPPDAVVVDLAFTPSLNASPRGYLLTESPPSPSNPVALYAIESAWPLVLTPVTANSPSAHNLSLGLGVSPDGTALYYTTKDKIYGRLAPSTAWVPLFALGSFGISDTAQVAGPAAGESPRIAILDGPVVHQVNLETSAVSTVGLSGLQQNRGTVFRECPQGGVRLVPQSGLTTTEAGGVAEFTAVLTTRPEADVTVRLKTTNPAEGRIRRRALVFTPSDWWRPQTVTVTGIPDGLPDGSQSHWITAYPLKSGDPAYDGREIGRIPVVNIDVDSSRPAPSASRRP